MRVLLYTNQDIIRNRKTVFVAKSIMNWFGKKKTQKNKIRYKLHSASLNIISNTEQMTSMINILSIENILQVHYIFYFE